MSDMSVVVNYPAAGSPDEPNVGALAQAVDATIDAIGDALADGNIGQATALAVAADAASDALLDALGVADADHPHTD